MLEEFNYLANKAINQYVNKRYNIYDVNQQTTDDLRVLKDTALLQPTKINDYTGLTQANGATYFVTLPTDYLHMLNCICIYDVLKTYDCYDKGKPWRVAAKRLTADAYSQVLDNYWNKPSYKNPYYYIHNINTKNGDYTVTDAPYDETTGTIDSTTLGTDGNGNTIVTASGLPKTIKIGSTTNASNVERGAAIRYGNASQVRCEIRYGTDDSVFKLKSVYIDYIKAPQHIRLTQEQIDYTEDKSQMLEFPDYVCQEIINELVHIIMENIGDGRIQTHPVVSQSIANPAQQQTEPVAQQQPT